MSLNGETLTNNHWGSQQTQTIGKILVTNRGKVVTSDKLIDILWPDEPIESARRRLHVRISQLRNVLQEKKMLIRTVHGGYIFQLDETCWLDVDKFQSHFSEGTHHQEIGQQIEAITAYENAREIYRGDFLAEDLYADWTYNHREALRESFINLLIELSECYAQQGRYRLAIARARQALAQDHLRETLYVRLMLYHYYAGEREQALRVFDRCCVVLENELGVTPLDSTFDLFEQVKAGKLWKNAEVPQYPPPIYEGRLFEVPYALTEIPLVGREREYAWLVSQWNDPSQRVILVEGEAGIGKTRLLKNFVEYIHSQGVRLLKVQLLPSEHRPTAAIVSSLSHLLTENTIAKLSPAALAALAILIPEIHERVNPLPTLPPLSPNGEHQRLKQAISALSTACAASPTILIVDDAQRLDSDAVDLLVQLSEAFRTLLSFRSEDSPPDHPIRKTFKPTGLTLKPLTLRAVQTLILQLSGQEHASLASRISTQGGGVPLYVVTLLQHMFETGQLFVNSRGDWETTSQEALQLPATLRATVEARLNHLNPVQRHIFDYAAILGGEFDFTLLQTATLQTEDSLLAILDDLLNAGLLIEPRSLGKPEFMISHDRYTEIAYETIPSVRRRHMHLNVAQAMERLYSQQLENHFPALADHYNKTAQKERAAHYATLAGEQAVTRFASNEALHYLEMALALTPRDNLLQLARLRLAREGVFDLLGMREEQNDDLVALETIQQDLPPQLQAEIYLRRAAYEWILGNDDKANGALENAIESAQSSNAKEIEARALLLAGRAALDLSQSIDYLQRAYQIAHEMKYHALEGDIVRCLGNATYWQNNYHKSQTLFTQALSIHREVGELRGELSALNNLGKVNELLGDLPKAVEHYAQAGEICRRIGDRLAEGVILTNLGSLKIDLGHYSEAQTLLERALMIRDEIRNDEGSAVAHKYLGDLFRLAGQYDLAFTHNNQAHRINLRIQHKEQTFETLESFSAVCRDLGDYQQAQSYLNQAAEISLDPDSHLYIHFLINASLLNTLDGDPIKALALGEKSLSLSQSLPLFHAPALKNMGHALLALARENDAWEYFQKSHEAYQAHHQAHLALEPLAGMAKIALIQEMPERSLSFVEEILNAIDEGPLEGPDRTLWIYLVCYQVLASINDQRAPEVIKSAYQLMSHRAGAISDENLRQSYLTGVRENHEIANIWSTLLKDH